MLAYQKYDNTLATDVTREVRGHIRKSNVATQRGKWPSSYPFFFFLSLWSCYLKWPPPLAVKISGVSVTCINRLHCIMVSAWGVIMTPAQAVCHSTLMVQKAHQRKRCSADLDPCTGPILLKSSKLYKGLTGQNAFLPLHLHLCVPIRRGSSTAQPLSSWTSTFAQDWGEGLATLFNKTGNEHHSVELVLGKGWAEEMVLHLTAYCREGESSYGRGCCKYSLRASYTAMYKPLVCNTGESK